MNPSNPSGSSADAALAHLGQQLDRETAPDFIWHRLADDLMLPREAHTPPKLMGHTPRPNRPRYWFLPPVIAVALTAWFSLYLLPLVGVARPSGQPVSGEALDTARYGSFIALQPLSHEAADWSQARVVATEVPRVWLASAGVAVAPERASEAVRIELIVDALGHPLAFRIPNL
jgi:hypothetical protein